MIVSLKIIINEGKRISLILYKTPELAELLRSLMTVLKLGFPDVNISNKNDYYQITDIGGAGTFATVKSFIEEVYIRFLDYEDSEESDFDKYFTI
ncbi:hypothetical protein LCGC14_2165100 [marine sediment metagenome]|uniref:Uncharacterized protein n=1 Tax=marine sediment metagenome TaxID=412755 RepID=A0A0F9EDW6_9ZZZZ